MIFAALLVAAAALPGGLMAAHRPQAQAGAALPMGTTLTPAGAEVHAAADGSSFGLLPQTIAVSPDGRWLATSDSGNDTKSLTVVDVSTNTVVQHLDLNKPTFAGIAFRDDDTLFLSAGTENGVWELTRPDQALLDPAGRKYVSERLGAAQRGPEHGRRARRRRRGCHRVCRGPASESPQGGRTIPGHGMPGRYCAGYTTTRRPGCGRSH